MKFYHDKIEWKTSETYIFFDFFQFFLGVPCNRKVLYNRKAEMNVSVFDGCNFNQISETHAPKGEEPLV